MILFGLLLGCNRADVAPTPSPAPAQPPAATAPADEPAPVDEAPPTDEPMDVTQETLLAPAGTPGETYFAPFPVAIQLDGDLGDWDGVPRVSLPPSAGQIQGSTAITFAAAADGEFLYIMGDVTDPRIITGRHGSDYWNEDSVEICINGTGDLTLTSYEDGVAQITIPPLNAGRPPEDAVVGGVRGDTAEALVAVVETAGGYVVEAAIPLKNRVWNIQREHGRAIGFQVHLNGASESSRNLKLIWSVFDKGDTSYQNPSVFGQLIFFEIGQADIVINRPTPTPAPEREPVPADALYRQPTVPVADRVDDLLARMTLAEKIGQMTLVEKNSIRAEDITERYIGGLLSSGGGYPEPNTPANWADMVNGFQDFALASHLGISLIYGVDAVHGHGNLRGATIFPHNSGLGAANNPDLMTRIGQVTAAEMIATGIYWNYGPAVSVPQDIRWGRTYEGYSENPELVSVLGTAYLRGLQVGDPAGGLRVLATPKHFVGDGGTAWGSSTTGSYLIDQGVTEVDEATLRALHLPPYVALVTAINAGIDMNMVPYDYHRFIDTLTRAVDAGDVSKDRIDDAVRRILTVKFELGLFEQPYSDPALLALVGSSEHRLVAREAVAQSQVLLKNEGGLLPLATDIPALYVGGQAADDIGIQAGGWTIEWQGKPGDITPGTTVLAAIQDTVSPDTDVVYDKFGRFPDGAAADPAAACIAVVGEEPYAEGHGDSADLRLPVNDLRVLGRMREQCHRLIVLLIAGRPLIVTELIDNWDALVMSWLPGTEGQGVADVLFGRVPFSGRLPYTWPRSVDQLPLVGGQLADGIEPPLFPLGYGLETR